MKTLKIPNTESNNKVLHEILDCLKGTGDEHDLITITSDGELRFYNSVVNVNGYDDNEEPVMENLTPDSFGDGWESNEATIDELKEWLEENCEIGDFTKA
jgi:hypothetical protein